jgi:hypothetical protein
VLVRLEVQVLAADRTEAGAVGPAEDLLRKRQRDRVARPGIHVELVVDEVRRAQLVASLRIRRLVLARVDRELDDGVGKAAVARAVQPRAEPQLEHGAGARARDDELRRNGVRDRQVTLTAVLERAQLELDLVAELLARPEADAAQVERLHASSLAPDVRPRSSGGGAGPWAASRGRRRARAGRTRRLR